MISGTVDRNRSLQENSNVSIYESWTRFVNESPRMISLMKFSLNVRDVIGLGSTMAVLIFWAATTFETKADVKQIRDEIRVESTQFKTDALEAVRAESTQRSGGDVDLDRRVQTLERSMGDIGRDVSYIRGRMEPGEKMNH